MMQEAKSVHLNYDNFNLNAANILRELGEKSEFADVTLVAEDQQIEAHKFVLSSSSPFFKILFHRNPHPHPMIYLKGVSFDNLQTILKFLYEGQAMVDVDNLKVLLETAWELQIKCLTNKQEEYLERYNEEVIKEAAQKSDDTTGLIILTEATAEDFFTFDDSEIEKDDLKHLIKKKTVKKEDEHGLACNKCDFISSSKPNLWRHNKSIHIKEKYSPVKNVALYRKEKTTSSSTYYLHTKENDTAANMTSLTILPRIHR